MADTKISALTAATTLGDTDELVLASAGANKKLTGANLKAAIPSGATQLSYVEQTSNVGVTGTTEGGSQTIVTSASLTYSGTQRICVEFFAPAVLGGSGGGVYVQLWDSTPTILGNLGYVQSPSGSAFAMPILAKRFLTPAAGTRSYSIHAYQFGASGSIFAGVGGSGTVVPAYIRITTA